MNKSTWATYIETVYGASYVVASSSPQLLYHPRLLDPRLEMPFPKPCFAYGGLGDRHCSAQALSLTDGHNVTLLSQPRRILYNCFSTTHVIPTLRAPRHGAAFGTSLMTRGWKSRGSPRIASKRPTSSLEMASCLYEMAPASARLTAVGSSSARALACSSM